MSYEDLLSQIYQELPHLKGQLNAPRVVYVKAQGKGHIVHANTAAVMSQLRAASRFCRCFLIRLTPFVKFCDLFCHFLRKHRGQPTSREHEIADCPKDHGKENDSKYSLSRFQCYSSLSFFLRSRMSRATALTPLAI